MAILSNSPLCYKFLFHKGENASHAVVNVISVYGRVTAKHVQFWFHRLHSSDFDVKDTLCFTENVDNFVEIVGSGRRAV